jgi:hypothetical protein
MIIVTTKEDKNTIDLCDNYGIQTIFTDRLYENGDKFNKGKAINDGVKHIKYNDWVLITDADMFLPFNFRETLDKQTLNVDNIYGTHRYICPTYHEWLNYRDTRTINMSWTLQGHRLAIGVGFFQLINCKSKIITSLDNKWYDENHGHAGRSDRMFLRKWPDENRKNLKINTIHLGNDELGRNWKGRTTANFISSPE